MSNVEPDEQEEKPLDPVMENVRRKMVRLQLVSAGIMGVMLMAVLAAIVYKVTQRTPETPVASSGLSVPSEQPLAATVALPSGFVVENTSLSGNQILFYGRLADGQRKALVFDATVGRIVADIAITGN
ncbi:hypothetical protein DEM27_05385 [Metarhizobium album]|uniref:Fimbrial protein n=1 Tax=Metarhizobium album TaxID=2182425 RepID=A0A2U2DUV2_9HYPH|nr:hypothetical protein [Rhizobium album]PWE57076.1 hypothetical protein DEM27_05385 [Rhizobium album]